MKATTETVTLELSAREARDIAEALGMLEARRHQSLRIAQAEAKNDPWDLAVDLRQAGLDRVKALGVRVQGLVDGRDSAESAGVAR